jgi:hypothetical protein
VMFEVRVESCSPAGNAALEMGEKRHCRLRIADCR